MAAQPYRTKAVSPEIYTIQVKGNGIWNKQPIITLNSNDFVNINFDRISENSLSRLRYRIIACDADWAENRNISESEFIDGFNDNLIEDYYPSLNTTVSYTNYNINIPNGDIALKRSGNYLVIIYEEDNPSNIMLTARISVLEPIANIITKVSSVTDIDANKGHQQVSLTVQHQLQMRDPVSELKVYVRQNNRMDDERSGLKPSMIAPGKIGYEHNRNLIFEAGNEYRRFETSSYKYNGINVSHIVYQRPNYLMDISTDKARAGTSYSYDQDQDGYFIVRNREGRDDNTEADYFFTNFTLTSDQVKDYNIYINGGFTDNEFSEKYKMSYDYGSGCYKLTLLLKQGLYNYQYLAKMPDGYSTSLIEGNYYQTENEYSVWVYYRPTGQRYDSFIGFSTIRSNQK